MMWETCAEKVRRLGGSVVMDRKASGCRLDSASSLWVVTARSHNGEVEEYRGEHLVSSMPIRELVAEIEPPLPEAALQAALKACLALLPFMVAPGYVAGWALGQSTSLRG